MKRNKLILLASVFMLLNSNLAKSQDQIVGVYHQSSGNPEGGNTFFILEDHKFVVAFFGGVLVGTWSQKNNQVYFKPFVNEHQFYIYGRHAKDLKNGSRINFQGFEEGPTFIGFNNKQLEKPILRRVFNPNPNCVSFPSVAKFNELPIQILFANEPENENLERADRKVYTFNNTKKYNDFIVYYHKEDQDRRPFFAQVKDGKLFFEYDEKGLDKHPLPTKGEDFEFIKQILAAPLSTDKVFYNPFYKQSDADINDKYNWKFDEQKNAYINFLNYVNGEENRPEEQDAYNKMHIVYQFDILELVEKKIKPFAIDQEPLFVATCGRD